MAGEFRGLALMFDDRAEGFYLKLMQEGAKQAGWTSLAFNNVHDALGHFTDDVNAVATGLGKGLLYSSGHPAEKLLTRADDRQVPRALVTDHPYAERYIRPSTTDILIVKTRAEEIPVKLSAWLLSLARED